MTKNIVLLGHGVGIKFVIESLIGSDLNYRVCGVVTHPFADHKSDLEMIERRKDIYGEYGYNVFKLKEDFNIELLESANVNDPETVNWIKRFDPSYIISVGCRNIIKREFLAVFPGKVLNIHTTALPRYRGAANDTWMILNSEWGKDLYGCMHYIDEGIDTGDIIAKTYYNIPKFSYPIDIYKIRTNTFRDIVTKGLKNLENEAFIAEKQDLNNATTFPRLYTPKDGKLNFKNWDGDQILKFIYAFGYPFQGAFCFLEDKKISILEAEFIETDEFHPFSFGLIFGKNSSYQYKVSVKGGYILILKLEYEGQIIEQKKVFKLGKYLV